MRKAPQDPIFNLERYQRGVLTNHGADPLVIDDAPRTSRNASKYAMNLTHHGHPSNHEAFLNEISLHDSTPDPRGSRDTPNMNLLAEHLYQKTAWVKSNLFKDDIGTIVGPETRTPM